MTISSRHPARAEALDPEDRARIAQQIRRRGGYYFPSSKTKASVACVTTLHRDLACHLEVDAAISGFEAYPERVVHSVGGELRTHIPAFRAVGRGRTYMLDVVQDDDDAAAADGEFADLLRAFYEERGILYRTLSSEFVRRRPVFDNVREVLSARGFEPARTTASAIVLALTRMGETTLGELVLELAGREHVRLVVLALVLRRRLKLDLTAADLSLATVSLGKGAVA